jgi:hypothetical protein
VFIASLSIQIRRAGVQKKFGGRAGRQLAAICESFGYHAFIVQRGEKIAALPAIAALGKNTSWGTDIESRNVLFLPR